MSYRQRTHDISSSSANRPPVRRAATAATAGVRGLSGSLSNLLDDLQNLLPDEDKTNDENNRTRPNSDITEKADDDHHDDMKAINTSSSLDQIFNDQIPLRTASRHTSSRKVSARTTPKASTSVSRRNNIPNDFYNSNANNPTSNSSISISRRKPSAPSDSGAKNKLDSLLNSSFPGIGDDDNQFGSQQPSTIIGTTTASPQNNSPRVSARPSAWRKSPQVTSNNFPPPRRTTSAVNNLDDLMASFSADLDITPPSSPPKVAELPFAFPTPESRKGSTTNTPIRKQEEINSIPYTLDDDKQSSVKSMKDYNKTTNNHPPDSTVQRKGSLPHSRDNTYNSRKGLGSVTGSNIPPRKGSREASASGAPSVNKLHDVFKDPYASTNSNAVASSPTRPPPRPSATHVTATPTTPSDYNNYIHKLNNNSQYSEKKILDPKELDELLTRVKEDASMFDILSSHEYNTISREQSKVQGTFKQIQQKIQSVTQNSKYILQSEISGEDPQSLKNLCEEQSFALEIAFECLKNHQQYLPPFYEHIGAVLLYALQNNNNNGMNAHSCGGGQGSTNASDQQQTDSLKKIIQEQEMSMKLLKTSILTLEEENAKLKQDIHDVQDKNIALTSEKEGLNDALEETSHRLKEQASRPRLISSSKTDPQRAAELEKQLDYERETVKKLREEMDMKRNKISQLQMYLQQSTSHNDEKGKKIHTLLQQLENVTDQLEYIADEQNRQKHQVQGHNTNGRHYRLGESKYAPTISQARKFHRSVKDELKAELNDNKTPKGMIGLVLKDCIVEREKLSFELLEERTKIEKMEADVKQVIEKIRKEGEDVMKEALRKKESLSPEDLRIFQDLYQDISGLPMPPRFKAVDLSDQVKKVLQNHKREMEALEDQLEKMKSRIKEKDDELTAARSKHDEIQKQVLKLEDKLVDTVQASAYHDLNAKTNKMLEEKKNLEIIISQLEDDLGQMARKDEEIKSLKGEVVALESNLHDRNHEISGLRVELSEQGELVNQMNSYAAEIEKLKGVVADKEKSVELAMKDKKRMMMEVESMQEQMQMAKDQEKTAREEMDRVALFNIKFKTEKVYLLEELDNAQHRVDVLNEEVDSLRREIEKKTAEAADQNEMSKVNEETVIRLNEIIAKLTDEMAMNRFEASLSNVGKFTDSEKESRIREEFEELFYEMKMQHSEELQHHLEEKNCMADQLREMTQAKTTARFHKIGKSTQTPRDRNAVSS